MREYTKLAYLFLCQVLLCATASAQDLDSLLATQRGQAAITGIPQLAQPRVSHKKDGAVSFIAATPGTYFESRATAQNAKPEDIARAFIDAQGAVLGIKSGATHFETRRVTTNKSVTYVRLAQTYQGLPVYGAEMMIAVLRSDGVTSVLSDIMRNTDALDDGTVSLAPSVGADEAGITAMQDLSYRLTKESTTFSALQIRDAQLLVYDSSVVADEAGVPVLAWKLTIAGGGDEGDAEESIVDAHSGKVLRWIPRTCTLLNRAAYDAENRWLNGWGTLRRSEGQGAYGIADVDALYDIMGLAYNFFSSTHGRNSYDGNGCQIRVTARWVPYWYGGCPNGGYSYPPADRFGFCSGLAVDDVVAHEFTHGVTYNTSGLIYSGESGAMNESMSDIWGEYVDLVNGTDQVGYEWKLGEGSSGGIIRDMAHPHTYSQPEVYLETGYWYSGGNQDRFVHYNSGVGNKLCHLLTAGDSSFRGSSYSPLSATLTTSISATAKLYYELQVNRLLSTSNYSDLGDVLYAAVVDAALGVINLGNDISWNAVAIQKVINASAAVGI